MAFYQLYLNRKVNLMNADKLWMMSINLTIYIRLCMLQLVPNMKAG